jgi:hypothetical protein
MRLFLCVKSLHDLPSTFLIFLLLIACIWSYFLLWRLFGEVSVLEGTGNGSVNEIGGEKEGRWGSDSRSILVIRFSCF